MMESTLSNNGPIRHSLNPRPLSNSSHISQQTSRHMASSMTIELPPSIIEIKDEDAGSPPSHDNCEIDHKHGSKDTISKVSSTSKVAGEAVGSFLARHIPDQYAPQGDMSVVGNGPAEEKKHNPNTKFCYRHRPDLKCRRTVDETSMAMMQKNLETMPQADQQAIAHVWSIFSAAPARHRNLMLDGILSQCCFPQLSHLSSSVRELLRIDFISALPAEISLKILGYLDPTSLCKAAQVSRRWRDLADDDRVWHLMCEQHINQKCSRCGWGLPLLEQKRLREWKRQQQLRAASVRTGPSSPEPTPLPSLSQGSPSCPETAVAQLGTKRSADELRASPSPEMTKRQCTFGLNTPDGSYFTPHQPRYRPWKEVYKDRFTVSTNWKYGRCSVRRWKAHDNGVMCLQFDDQILATGSYDNTIKIWDIETGELKRTLKGHTLGIRTLQFDDTKLISGSLDGTIRVWYWRTGELKSVINAHTAGVISLHFDGQLLASGSIDKTVVVYNFGENPTKFVLSGHDDWVNSVKVDTMSRTVFSASDDCSVKLWDLDTRKCIKTFLGHVGQVQQVLPMPAEFEPEDSDSPDNDEDTISVSSNNSMAANTDIRASYGPAFSSSSSGSRPLPPRYIVTAALDSTIRLWDVGTGRCIKKFFGHVEGVWAVGADTLRIVTGAEDRMVKIWDPKTGKCDKTFTGHAGPVTCLGLSDSRIVTGSEDCEIRIHSFKSEAEVETPALMGGITPS